MLVIIATESNDSAAATLSSSESESCAPAARTILPFTVSAASAQQWDDWTNELKSLLTLIANAKRSLTASSKTTLITAAFTTVAAAKLLFTHWNLLTSDHGENDQLSCIYLHWWEFYYFGGRGSRNNEPQTFGSTEEWMQNQSRTIKMFQVQTHRSVRVSSRRYDQTAVLRHPPKKWRIV